MTAPDHGAAWIEVCDASAIAPETGVCARVGDDQVALFRLRDFRVFAVSNHDPFSGANVLSRGILGEHSGTPTVASPVYKQRFSLVTGDCLDDPAVSIPVFSARVRGGVVEIRAVASAVTDAA